MQQAVILIFASLFAFSSTLFALDFDEEKFHTTVDEIIAQIEIYQRILPTELGCCVAKWFHWAANSDKQKHINQRKIEVENLLSSLEKLKQEGLEELSNVQENFDSMEPFAGEVSSRIHRIVSQKLLMLQRMINDEADLDDDHEEEEDDDDEDNGKDLLQLLSGMSARKLALCSVIQRPIVFGGLGLGNFSPHSIRACEFLLEKEEDDQDDEDEIEVKVRVLKECILCQDAEPNILLDCGHIPYCGKCDQEALKKDKNCPLCRKKSAHREEIQFNINLVVCDHCNGPEIDFVCETCIAHGICAGCKDKNKNTKCACDGRNLKRVF